MKLRCFPCINEGWARKNLIMTPQDARALAVFNKLNPTKVQKRQGKHGPGFYYGSTCIALAKILSGELRTDVAGASCEKPVLVLENGAHLGPDELDGYDIVHANGSEMVWARGAEEE